VGSTYFAQLRNAKTIQTMLEGEREGEGRRKRKRREEEGEEEDKKW